MREDGDGMKRILLVGRFNEFYKFLNSELSRYFGVQMCSDDLQLLMGLLKMSRPEAIMISASELDESHREIFSYIIRQCEDIPAWCIGNKEELERIQEFGQTEKIGMLQRPIRLSEIVTAVSGETELMPEAEQHDNTEKIQRRKTILLVDDAVVQLRAMKNILSDRYNVEMATSGRMAIEIVKKRRFDLILLDYNMPEQDGKETFEQIRAQEEGKDVPVVFVTGVNERKRIMDVLKMNPAGYLIKPVQREDLLKMTHQLLEESAGGN